MITEMGDSFHRAIVIPAKAGIYFATVKSQRIPAFAGMTVFRNRASRIFTMPHAQ